MCSSDLGDDGDEHRGDHGAPGVAVDQPVAHEAVGRGQDPPHQAGHRVVDVLGAVVGPARAPAGVDDLPDGGADQEGAEDVEDDAEALDEGGAGQDIYYNV